MNGSASPPSLLPTLGLADGSSPICGLPIDTQHFDVSGLTPLPEPGRQVILARFELPAHHCGRFENFSQFTDAWARSPVHIDTPGLRWQILVNGRPLSPFLGLEHIVNPWGYGSFAVAIRLDPEARLEFVVRNVGYAPDRRADGSAGRDRTRIHTVGGRLVGRYWYNSAFGNPGVRRP